MENPSARKASRIDELEALLLMHPEGMLPAEIARRLGVNRSTIGRYLPDLPKHIYIEEDGRWKVDRGAYLVDVRFNLHEALAVHLAARLLATRMDRQNPHAAATLRKLGVALEKLAPHISTHLGKTADAMDDESAWSDPGYLQVLETLSIAWAEGRKVKVWHRQEKGGKVLTYTFSPYFIEPYAVGQSTHAIGYREPPGKLRTFKIERIERVELMQETYTIPSEFDPRALLADAWGIWYTEEEPVEVVLRFRHSAAARVKESRWYRLEEVTDQEDGSLIWRARIAEPRELLPWIRGWGADVEVLEPLKLRDAIVQEAGRLARLYQITPLGDSENIVRRLLRLWGKTPRGETNQEIFHPAVYHMIDVGNMARELLGEGASPRWRKILARTFGTDPESVGGWMPLLVALHDIGKISASFQGQIAVQQNRLKSEGFNLGKSDKLHHTVTGQIFDFFELNDQIIPKGMRLILRDATGGHHGQFLPPNTPKENRGVLVRDEPADWAVLRQECERLLRNIFLKTMPENWTEPANRSAAVMGLTGFTILCDWLGSDERFFACQPDIPMEAYIEISRKRAQQAVLAAGFCQAVKSQKPGSFREIFPKLTSLRPLQAAIDEIPADILSGPYLAILEAPTGEGKTEAALALAHRSACQQGSDEFYYALPTTATSDQMFGRVQYYLDECLKMGTRVNLVHSQAFLREDDQEIEPLENGTGEPENEAFDWFGPKKRALLAPFGVGTIDQVELGALNTRHNALRLLGLAGKTLILDEVHAYDTYMTTIIERLLKWLAAMGTSVILLSATLPKERRARMLQAYLGEKAPKDANGDSYPNLIVAGTGNIYQGHPPAAQAARRLEIAALALSDEQAKAAWLVGQVQEDGCACWITNTVDRAQRIFEALQHLAPPDTDLLLLHARFPLADRQQLERRLVSLYGPTGKRPRRGIVIGTQVLEQSLDLDFDVMVSDLAPVDLLLQRAGRLHRHDRQRPGLHSQARLYIAIQPGGENELDLGSDEFIYPEYILRRTWQAVEERIELKLPEDYRELIEFVYGNEVPVDEKLAAAWQKMNTRAQNDAQQAVVRLMPEPDPLESFCGKCGLITFEESEDRAGWIVAQTRLGERSLIVIPMVRNEGGIVCPGVEGFFQQDTPIPRAIQLEFMRRSLRISHRTAVEVLSQQNALPLPVFAKSALLKRTTPLWLKNGRAEFVVKGGTLVLTLHPLLGLVIRKEKGA